DGDTESFPEELDNFLHKRFIFKIQISEFNLQQKWPIYTVIRVTDDDSLIEEYLSSSIESNENLELDESIKHGEQITDVDTDTFSITCSSSSITPLKRSIPDNDRGEDLSVDTVPAQHSCSKMKKIKIEKEDV
ncbi:hypothetical protein Taro_011835, partial [Colocasia esculenta]|nr:hypothetical protein [Colocasia esculenta]